MAAADDFPDLYYPDANGDFAWDSPCWNDDWEYDLIDDGHKTLQEWNKENRTIAKGEEGIYLPCAKKTVFDKAQTIPIHKNNYTPMYFKTHDEAISWAKNNPDKVITRSNDGIGYIEKTITTETNIRENNIQTFSTHKDITLIGNLMWENISYSQEEENAYNDDEGYGHVMDWHEAMTYAKNLRLGGYDDWRLPTIEELGEVVKLCGGEFARRRDNAMDNRDKRARNKINAQYQEAYKLKGFASVDYWSSTSAGSPAYDHEKPLHSSFGDDSCCAWIVYFGISREKRHYKTSTLYVRCVR